MKYTSVSLFRQVLDLISKREFEEVVMKHNGDLAAHWAEPGPRCLGQFRWPPLPPPIVWAVSLYITQYTLDAAGIRTAVIETGMNRVNRVLAFEYDDLYQLTREVDSLRNSLHDSLIFKEKK